MTPSRFEQREGEEQLPFDPASLPADGHVIFIGRINSPWKTRQACPKNMQAARETGKTASVSIEPPYRPGLRGLEGISHIVILTWLDQSPRNLIVQKPRHATESKGVFALRSPVRPNPVGLHVVKLLGIDLTRGELEVEAIDALDGTPVIDLKPYYASVDAFPEAIVNRSGK